MRAIIFRGRYLDDKNQYKWVYGSYVKRSYTEQRIYSEYDETYYTVDRTTIGQYTGKRDKTGEKIFEGDIVKFDCGDEGEERGLVYYNAKLAGFCMYSDSSEMPIEMDGTEKDGEVIGNIHDNPERFTPYKNTLPGGVKNWL